MKKKLLTIVILLLTLAVLAVLFIPKTTRVTAKLENDNAEILQVDIKSKDFLFLEDKATGSVRLTARAELITYYPVGCVIDINSFSQDDGLNKYPLELSLTRRDRSDDDRSVLLYFDKDEEYFAIKVVGGEIYRFPTETATAETIAMVDDYVA